MRLIRTSKRLCIKVFEDIILVQGQTLIQEQVSIHQKVFVFYHLERTKNSASTTSMNSVTNSEESLEIISLSLRNEKSFATSVLLLNVNVRVSLYEYLFVFAPRASQLLAFVMKT